jgi:hypothetical protein
VKLLEEDLEAGFKAGRKDLDARGIGGWVNDQDCREFVVTVIRAVWERRRKLPIGHPDRWS